MTDDTRNRSSPRTRLIFATATEAEAPTLVRALVHEGLVACGNILPGARSFYAWQGEVQDDREAVLLMETDESHQAAAIERLVALHSYDVPKVLVLEPTDVLPAYRAWLGEVLA